MPSPPEAAADQRRRELRRALIAARLAMPAAARAAASRAIEAGLDIVAPPGRHSIVGGYWPIRGEFDPRPYLLRCLEAGAGVALPVAIGPAAPLAYRRWTPSSRLESGRWGLMHPVDESEASPDMLLVPLVGFDAAGHRLGYGGGWFDRTLAAPSAGARAIGVGFESGRLASVEPLPHDQPLDAIVTEAGVATVAASPDRPRA